VRFIGVDPGVSGGLAAIDAEATITVFGAMRMPETDEGFVEAVEILTENGTRQCVAILEQVNAGVFAGGRSMGVTSAFTFGGCWRGIRVAFVAAKVPVIDVRPLRWQTALNCRTKGDKNISKAKALELFPSMHVTHALADALLLAEYGRRFHGRG
jgi:membrane-associated phospholipid phosphatase